MTRTAAREIAVHFAFELGFTNQTAEELLAEALNRKTFEQIGEEEPLYAEFPNEKQREYISKLVKGVYEHSPELDEYISKYAIGWKYSRLNRVAIAIMRVAGPLSGSPAWRRPSCGRLCMRSCICRISPTPPPSMRRWR